MTDSAPDTSSGSIPVCLFSLGELCATPGVLLHVPWEEQMAGLARHAAGDWGILDEEDRLTNNRSLESGSRLLSAYDSKAGVRFWIITEWDRSYTTFLLPEEY
jgi:hypothetical protein